MAGHFSLLKLPSRDVGCAAPSRSPRLQAAGDSAPVHHATRSNEESKEGLPVKARPTCGTNTVFRSHWRKSSFKAVWLAPKAVGNGFIPDATCLSKITPVKERARGSRGGRWQSLLHLVSLSFCLPSNTISNTSLRLLYFHAGGKFFCSGAVFYYF